MATSPIGIRVRARRKTLGLTQAALAQAVGVSASYLNLIENGKRSVGGALLLSIAKALQTDLETLDDEEGRRLVAALDEIAMEPVVRDAQPSRAALSELVGRHPDWARAALLLHRAYAARDRTAAALSDRLSQDPVLQEDLHRLISHVSAIRSASEILEDVGDLTEAQLRRFLGMIGQESGRLASVARALTGFFQKTEANRALLTPAEEVDDFIAAHQNHFPDLEDAADRMRREAALEPEAFDLGLARRLETRHGLRIEPADQGAAAALGPRGVQLEAEAGRILVLETAPPARRRFELTRIAAALEAEEAIASIVENDPRLRGDEAKRRARRTLASYTAAAALAPYGVFFAESERLRYDLEALAHRFALSLEQTAHRFTTLRRPGATGAPFGFMRVDPSGFVTKRFALPGMPLPRLGGACPLWAVYRAFQTPGRLVTQLAELPTGERFVLIAVTQEKTLGAGPGPRHLVSIQLACDAIHADRLIYGAALAGEAGPNEAFSARGGDPVGATCRLCVRQGCPARQEAMEAGGA